MAYFFHEIPTLGNYHSARQHFDSVKPIRGKGRNAGKVPLGERRKHWMHMRELPDKSIECVLYNTPCVTYNVDGTIQLQNDSWNTNTTVQFINALLMHPVGYVSRSKDNMRFNTGNYTFVIPHDGGLTLHYDEKEGRWLPNASEVDQITIHKIDRKAMNKVRAQYAWALKYIRGLVKMWDYQMERSDYLDSYKNNVDIANRLGALRNGHIQEGDLPKLNKLVANLLHKFGHIHFNYQTRQRDIRLAEPGLEKALQWMLLAMHWDDVAREEVLPYGVYKKDRLLPVAEWVHNYGALVNDGSADRD